MTASTSLENLAHALWLVADYIDEQQTLREMETPRPLAI